MRKRYLVAAGVLVLVAATAVTVVATRYAPEAGGDFSYPRLKYADSLLSGNDRCMVRHMKLNPDVHPVYVNGVPMGFC